jgi:hypothetical protein
MARMVDNGISAQAGSLSSANPSLAYEPRAGRACTGSVGRLLSNKIACIDNRIAKARRLTAAAVPGRSIVLPNKPFVSLVFVMK